MPFPFLICLSMKVKSVLLNESLWREVVAGLAKTIMRTSSKDLESYLAPVAFSFFKMSISLSFFVFIVRF